ncbi:Gfo/Idh/MocA family oxidoreductase [Bacillus tianshenii]|nr:Gfo/Idh/MocA family oxidoreductase [Bacillus tianshenii]
MVNFAIVGCGHIAKKHAEAIEKCEGAKLVAVCDKVHQNMEFFTKEFGAKAYTELEALLDNQEVEVVNICTPSGTHAPIAIEVAKTKKHIVVEKPMALTLTDADRMINTCNEYGVKLAVVHPNRFRPAIIELKKVLEKKLLGKISHVNATVRWNRNQAYFDQADWRGTKNLDGGVLMNQAIHNLDLILWLIGDVQEVFSMDATRLRMIEAEDVSVGVTKFKNGALGVIEAATTIYPTNLEETLSIFGETGTVKIGGTTANLIEHWNLASMSEEEVSHLKQTIQKDPFGKPGHQWIIEDMVHAIEDSREPIITGTDGRKALELVLALYQSAQSNERVLIS